MITIGHRGASGFAPENTILSFQKALHLKVDMIEFDVQLCKSGEVVVIHDATLNRTTNGKGFVADQTLQELKKWDAGSGQSIPTLDESLAWIGNGAKINIELKENLNAKIVIETINQHIVKGHIQMNDVLLSSYCTSHLRVTRKINPDIKIGLLYDELPRDFERTVDELQAYSVSLDFNFITREIVSRIHSLKAKVFAFTVNGQADKLKMKEMGVDGIFTDFP